MKRVVVLAALAAALGGSCKRSPDADQASAAATQRAPRLAHPLLWSAEKDGKTTFFLGTMHAGIDAEAQLPPLVWSKLHDAKRFAMEADLDDPAAAAMIRPTTGSLRRELGEAYWRKLENAVGERAATAADHLPPMVLAAGLSLRGMPPTPAMDRVLSERAESEHKAVVYLEPAARQLALLGKWMDVKALKLMLDELPANDQRIKAMLAAYTEGDERKLLAISDSEKQGALEHGYTAGEYEQEMNELLYDRNASWIEALEKLHADGGGFVAVGALHLVGPRSVLELLAHKGYRVTRVAP